jgi:hypothetical protein
MAVISVQTVSLTGLSASYTAAATAGDEFANDGRTFIYVMNADSAATTVTVASVTNCSYGFDHDAVVSVPAGSEIHIGPFNRSRFNAADGNVDVTYSSVASLTLAAISVP